MARSGQSLVTRALADQMPRATEVQLDGFVLAFTALASILTGLAAGLIAGARLMRGDLNDSLKQGLGKSDSYAGGKGTRTCAGRVRSDAVADSSDRRRTHDSQPLGAARDQTPASSRKTSSP